MQQSVHNISAYNALVKRVAASHSIEFGMDTPKARSVQARWMRRIRKELPFRNYGRTWA